MNTEVFVVTELCEYGVRNSTDTHLQCCTVLDKTCAEVTNLGLHLVWLCKVSLFEWLVVLYEDINLRRVNHCITPSTWYILVDNSDYCVSALNSCQSCIYRSTERNITVLVRGRNLNHSHITRYCARTIQLLSFAEENWNIVGKTCLSGLTNIATHEERVELEYALELCLCVWCRTFGVEVVDMHILQLSCTTTLAHSLNQTLRCRSNR